MTNPVPTPAEALRCGDHPKFGGRPLGLGCGQIIEGPDVLYRCAQCDTAFHKNCIRQHFDWPEAGGGPLPHALDAGLAALASQPAADLDVEQLARAFVMVGMELDGLTPEEGHAMVERLAAAYRDAKRSKE